MMVWNSNLKFEIVVNIFYVIYLGICGKYRLGYCCFIWFKIINYCMLCLFLINRMGWLYIYEGGVVWMLRYVFYNIINLVVFFGIL